jgi:peptidoglycan-associated lipoprotein
MPSAPASVVPVTVEPYLDPSSAIYKNRSIFFDFDQFQIKPDDMTVLEQHAKYLAGHPTVSIKIEGNTDEQGGAEYNLALGQKRAEAVLRFLKTYGVHNNQLEAISFGKEKPRALGHDEISHAQNRRADLAYPAK